MPSNKRVRTCQICEKQKSEDLLPGVIVRPAVAELILKTHGSWSESGWICNDDLLKFRHLYVKTLLEAEKGEITSLEQEVLNSLEQQDILARNPEADFQADLTMGQRLADRIASIGGSWNFIIGFISVLFIWILINSMVLLYRPFDPYPFILLNLVLSCLAAIQAPVIMMSQGRQETRDRLHMMQDYQVNLKAELEIRHLHQKIDHLLSHQWERLIEIQDIQMELISELRRK